MNLNSNGISSRVRGCLLASTALLAVPAAAQDVTPKPTISINDPQIVISQPGTPSSALDGGVTGVGQMIVDQQNGFIGLCTGSLINPRTVIFAAHCVNENPAGTGFQDPWGYGAKQGGLPIAFGFLANNNVAGNSAFGKWLSGAQQYQTSTANFLYNVNQVIYNADSTKLGIGNNFLQGDVALASLDTPAANVPTWAVLLSALPQPNAISDTTGTGYHVTEIGYGNNGVGPTGGIGGIDYRRRAAENYVGLLGSLEDVDLFLFGEPDGLPQNLYQLDFDDPRRGTAAASPFDFNAFKDNALPKEGITSEGDSGGPLVLDRTFAKQVIIGVLSGGSRYFNGQAGGSYGTTSFYQPLYLFWDYIAANNPYRYASALAGDGNWTDPTHWQTNLDPAYQVISGGQLVNGVPTVPGDGINGTSGKFGQICFAQGGVSDCYDNKTGIETVNGVPVTTTAPADSAGAVGTTANADSTKTANGKAADGMTVIREAQNGTATASSIGNANVSSLDNGGGEATALAGNEAAAITAAALPAATLANGLPGATNFVPNNIDPNAATKTNARYFDVTLSAAGTTTLGSAVTVDKFTVSGAGSKLNITTAGSLTSLIGVSQYGGLVQVDGTLTTRGDYFLMSGGLTGSGRINAPFFTSAAGMIAPGTIGGIGTLTIGGNAILASGNALLIDLGANGTSDKLAVVATSFNGTTPLDGKANIGGIVGFAPAAGNTIRFGDLYTIVTAQGGVTGTFGATKALSAILTPAFVYSANAVQVKIAAGRYADVVQNTPVQTAYAKLLDADRVNYGAMSELYGILDSQNAATIQATLEGLAPRTETLVRSLGTVATDNLARFHRDRLAQMDVRGGLGGSLTMIGQPLQLAALATMNMPGTQETASDSGGLSVREGVLPDNTSAFLAGGYIDGSSRSMPGTTPQGTRDQFDGWFVAGGVEKEIDDNAALGLSFSYTRTDGDTSGVAQTARGELYSGTLYGKLETAAGITLDTQFSAGVFQANTDRSVALVTTNYRLRSRDNALALSSEVGLGKAFDLGTLKVGPRVAVRASHLGFTPTAETGGAPALRLDRGDFDSLQARAGLNLSGGGVRFRPYASAYYVHDFQDKPGFVGANFVGGLPNTSALFALAGQDKSWAEFSAGMAFGGETVQLSLGADTTVARSDVKNQAYRGSVKIRF